MKKYKILPKEAIIHFFILIMMLFITLVIIDRCMPQYEKWEKENNFLNEDRMKKMSNIRRKDYPLIELRRKELGNEETKKKILVIGDSYIEGDGCNNLNQTWWRQLELELYSRGYYNIEVYGVGRRGASTYNEMNWLSKTTLVEDIKPDLIIIGYVINDPEIDDEEGKEIIKHTESIDYFKKDKILKIIKQMFPNITYKINNMINDKIDKIGEFNDETGYPYYLWYDVITNEKWSKKYDEIAVQPLGKYLNSIEIPSFVVTTPDKINSKFEKWYQILSLFEKARIKVYNMYSEFKDIMEKNPDDDNTKINLVDGHPGTLYTKYYAKYVSDILEKDYPQILGKKGEEKIEYPICINDWVPYDLDLKEKEEKENYAIYTIKYPKHALTMPINEEYIKISLQYPIAIQEINLKGKTLKKAKIYITTINEKLGYDDQTMNLIGGQIGNNETFQVKDKSRITSICIQADVIKGKDLEITIKK